MTMMVWQDDSGVEGDWSDVLTDEAQFLRADAGGPVLVVDTETCSSGVDNELRPSGEMAARWLLITPVDHGDVLTQVEAMYAGRRTPFVTVLQRSLSAEGAPQRDRVGFRVRADESDDLPDACWELPDTRKFRSVMGNSYEVWVPCTLQFSDAPPGSLVAWPGGRIWCDIGTPVRTPTGDRVLWTPLAVLGDLALLPIELLTVFVWW